MFALLAMAGDLGGAIGPGIVGNISQSAGAVSYTHLQALHPLCAFFLGRIVGRGAERIVHRSLFSDDKLQSDFSFRFTQDFHQPPVLFASTDKKHVFFFAFIILFLINPSLESPVFQNRPTLPQSCAALLSYCFSYH